MRCVVVLPPRHPLAAHKLLTPALLSGHPMVAPVRSLQLPSRLQAAFAAAGAQLNAVVEAEFLATLCGLVAAGTGWSLVDRLSAESFSHLGLVARPFEPAILYEVGVFHRRDREPSTLAAAFLEVLEGKLGG
jgi:DNA-binding transcriptional LysR family regulator